MTEFEYRLKDWINDIKEILSPFAVFIHQPRIIVFFAIPCIFNILVFRKVQTEEIGLYLFIQSPIITLIYIIIALSNPLEWLYRKLEDVRHIATKSEKEYLIPIFKEVYKQAIQNYPYIGKNIQLYIVDTMKIESFALGRNTIAVTRGMIETVTPEQLKGILAHEFSHIALCHSQTKLIIAVTSGIFLWTALLIDRLLMTLINLTQKSIISLPIEFIHFIFSLIIKFVFNVADLIIFSGGRSMEYTADKTVQKIGYGEQLKSALYKIYDMEITDHKTLAKRIYAEHPRTAYRIERLENLLLEH